MSLFLFTWLVPLITFSLALFLSLLVQYKVWVKPSAEQSYLYGNHVLKSGLGRITENTPQYQGVVVYSMGDTPLVSREHATSLTTWSSRRPVFDHLPYTKVEEEGLGAFVV